MNIIQYPRQEEWAALLERPHRDASELRETVKTVLDQIRQYGDSAVKAFEEKFDKVRLDSLAVSQEEMQEAEELVPDDLKDALKLAKLHTRQYVKRQRTWLKGKLKPDIVLDAIYEGQEEFVRRILNRIQE